MKICIFGESAEIVEKKSRFIANVKEIVYEQDALDFIESIKKKYWDARHNCYAYITLDGKIQRFFDDGEPQGTAGKPMLEVLNHQEIVGICVVVTRYFGGILLGTGGLIRAYQGASVAGISASKVLTERCGFRLKFNIGYEDYGKFNYLCEKFEVIRENVGYTDVISMDLVVEDAVCEAFLGQVLEESSGRISPVEELKIRYVQDGSEVIEMK